jgi:hypothetical protein
MPRANDRGLFEKEPGSGVWWICYFDQQHRKRREVAGAKARARELYDQRKQEMRLAKQSPEIAAQRRIYAFGEIADGALVICRRHTEKGYGNDLFQMSRMRKWWGAMDGTEPRRHDAPGGDERTLRDRRGPGHPDRQAEEQ